jgi:hypothetical protein
MRSLLCMVLTLFRRARVALRFAAGTYTAVPPSFGTHSQYTRGVEPLCSPVQLVPARALPRSKVLPFLGRNSWPTHTRARVIPSGSSHPSHNARDSCFANAADLVFAAQSFASTVPPCPAGTLSHGHTHTRATRASLFHASSTRASRGCQFACRRLHAHVLLPPRPASLSFSKSSTYPSHHSSNQQRLTLSPCFLSCTKARKQASSSIHH